uniref:Uncharacterized protein n=1 Tax=Mycena chlorophos TaxID=658473 RepID=A0ABQ0L453_MYCCL|nr:predicted protein [Mycena chlorophos]
MALLASKNPLPWTSPNDEDRKTVLKSLGGHKVAQYRSKYGMGTLRRRLRSRASGMQDVLELDAPAMAVRSHAESGRGVYSTPLPLLDEDATSPTTTPLLNHISPLAPPTAAELSSTSIVIILSFAPARLYSPPASFRNSAQKSEATTTLSARNLRPLQRLVTYGPQPSFELSLHGLLGPATPIRCLGQLCRCGASARRSRLTEGFRASIRYLKGCTFDNGTICGSPLMEINIIGMKLGVGPHFPEPVLVSTPGRCSSPKRVVANAKSIKTRESDWGL